MKKPAKVLLSALVLALAAISGAAIPARLHAYERAYYDETGQLVGEEVYHCYGPVWRWGVTTPHVTELTFRCLGDGGTGE